MQARSCRLPVLTRASLLLLIYLLTNPSPASSAPSHEHVPTAAVLYDRSLDADDHFSYQGRQITTYWRSGHTVTTLVSHRAAELDRLDYLTPESEMGRVFLYDGHQEWRFYPRARLVYHRLISANTDAVADAAAAYALLRANYFITVAPKTLPWAGRKTYLLMIVRRSNHKLARRLWIDAVTGLELKHEAYRENGRLAVTTAFSTITFHPLLTAAEFSPTRLTRHARMVEEPRDPDLAIPLASVGHRLGGTWLIPASLAGYHLVSAALTQSRPPRLHLRYSDGLNLVSLFELRRSQTRQPTLLVSPLHPPRPVSIGAAKGHVVSQSSLTAINWDTAAFNLTLMGEIAQTTLQRLALAVGDRHP